MIGIFDSGVGGLTVVKEFKKRLGDYDFAYFGDTARYPYGTKGEDTIIKYAIEDAKFLISKGAKIIIIACNTVSSVAISELKKKFKDIPIFEVVTPAVKSAVAETKNNRIGLIGTNATISSKVYEEKIKKMDPKIKVFSKACPLFVPLVEEGWFERPETKMIARNYLQGLKTKNIDTLILGCTHYPMIKKVIQLKIGKRIKLIDSAYEVIGEIERFLKENTYIEKGLSKAGKNEFYFSDAGGKVEEVVSKWMKLKIKVRSAKL